MSVYDFRERIDAELDLNLAELATAMINGRASDYAEYRFLVGQVRGLHVAKGIIDKMFKRMTEGRVSNDDESDEGRASG
jgi:hypothetical protein